MDTSSLHFERSKRQFFGIRVVAILETLGMLLILLLIDSIFLSGDRFAHVSPHPFFIPVLLVAAQYGTVEGLMAALLASLFFLVGNIPPQPEGVDHYDYIYSIAINPILWIISGWAIGEVRQRHVRERDVLTRELSESQQREDLISTSYNFVKNRKEALEAQVSGQLMSSIEGYRAAKAVETLDPKSVMQGVEQLVSSVLNPQKFSLFIFHDNKLVASILHGWEGNDTYEQQIDTYSPLYQAIVGQQELLVVANEQHEVALGGQGVMAGPIIDPESKRVVGMLKIEQIDFVSLSLNTIETFRSLCEWIGTAMINARNYQVAKSESVVNPERNLLSYNYFKRQSDYLAKLAKRASFNLAMLVIKINDAKSLSDEDRITVARQIGESVRNVLRSVDLAFDYQTDGEEYSILLPSTTHEGTSIVRDKIAKDLSKALQSKSHVSFNYIVSMLHETR